MLRLNLSTLLFQLLRVSILLNIPFMQAVEHGHDGNGKFVTNMVSQWDPFCKDCTFFKPYIRVFQGRNGPLLLQKGPGFLTFPRGDVNLYVCTNGVTFLYFEEDSHQVGTVFHDVTTHWAPHYCRLYNAKCGPGRDSPKRHLVAAILLGDPLDYRRPSLQLFVAPVFREDRKGYENLTSLAMISSEGECILEKGLTQVGKIRVRLNPVEEEPKLNLNESDSRVTFCRLDSKSHLGPGIPALDEVHGSTKEQVHDALTCTKPIIFKECLPYPNYNEFQGRLIQQRFEETSKSDFGVVRKYDTSKDPFWTPERLKLVGGDPFLPPAATRRAELNDEITQAKYDLSISTHPTVTRPATRKLKYAEAQLELMEYQVPLLDILNELKEQESKVVEAWKMVHEDFSESRINETFVSLQDTLKNVSYLREQMRLDPYDVEVLKELVKYQEEGGNLEKQLRNESVKLGRLVSRAEALWSSYERLSKFLEKSYEELKKGIEKFEKSGSVPRFMNKEKPISDVVVVVENKDKVKACEPLPSVRESCRFIKPTSGRACMLLRSRKGLVGPWDDPLVDGWRDEVLEGIGKIFRTVCPYLPEDFSKGVHGILKGYLLGQPKGVDPGEIVAGAPNSMAYAYGYHLQVENSTISELSPNLNLKDPFWDIIIEALTNCSEVVKPLEFFYDEKKTECGNILFAKKYAFNKTERLIPTKILQMKEQADVEFALNWAVDMSWKIFATVLGICMPAYERKIPLITARFYGLYNQDFLNPLRQIWMSHRDNPIFKGIFGRYYSGNGDKWAGNCLEASFVQSGDRLMRPPRGLYVNDFTELNFFVSGPMAGSRGPYAAKYMQ